MASAANVRKDPMGNKLSYFSRYYDKSSKVIDLFAQKGTHLFQIYCFPPIPIIGMVMKYLQQHQLNCVLVLPAMNFRWVNIVSAYIQDLQVLAAPFDHTVFTVFFNEGKSIPKRYPFAMIAVKLDFYPPCTALNKLFL